MFSRSFQLCTLVISVLSFCPFVFAEAVNNKSEIEKIKKNSEQTTTHRVEIKNDPTKPLSWQRVSGKKGQEALKLNSLLISKTRKVAIINGKRVKEGDVIGNAKVVTIKKGKVVVSRNGQYETLKLKPNPIKRVVRK